MSVAANDAADNAAQILLHRFISLNYIRCANQSAAGFAKPQSAVYEMVDKKLGRLPSTAMEKMIAE